MPRRLHHLYLRLFISVDEIFAYYALREGKNGTFTFNNLFNSSLLSAGRHSPELKDTVIEKMVATFCVFVLVDTIYWRGLGENKSFSLRTRKGEVGIKNIKSGI